MSDYISTTTPSPYSLRHFQPDPVEYSNSLRVYSLEVRFLPTNHHGKCFSKFIEYSYDFHTTAFPTCRYNLCDPDYFYQERIISRLSIAFAACFAEFKKCKNERNNPNLEFLCEYAFSHFMVHFNNFVKEFNKLEDRHMPNLYELAQKCFQFWIECNQCKLA